MKSPQYQQRYVIHDGRAATTWELVAVIAPNLVQLLLLQLPKKFKRVKLEQGNS